MPNQTPVPPDTPKAIRQGDLLDLHCTLIGLGCLLINGKQRELATTEIDQARAAIARGLEITTPLLQHQD